MGSCSACATPASKTARLPIARQKPASLFDSGPTMDFVSPSSIRIPLPQRQAMLSNSSSPAVAAKLPLGREKLPDLRRERGLDLHQPFIDAYLASMVHLVGDVKVQKVELRHLLPVHSLHLFAERLFSELPEGLFSRLHS